MKKLISLFLSVAILFAFTSINTKAESSNPFDTSNYNNPELDLTKITVEDLTKMSSQEYAELINDFERVYDPFSSYEQETSPDEIESDLNILHDISNDNTVAPTWTSGDYNSDNVYTEVGTHEAITVAACEIMSNDRGFFSGVSSTSAGIMLYISLASLLPDRDEDNQIYAGHFYDPETGENWLGNTENTARNNAQNHYNTALQYAKNGNMEKAYEYLGRCLHYVQDLNVPHHAANVTALNLSHGAFEQYAEDNFDTCLDGYTSIGVNNYDYYPSQYSVGGISHLAAHYSKERISYVNNKNDQSKWPTQARIGLRNAARYSVMVMYKFGNEKGVPFYEN